MGIVAKANMEAKRLASGSSSTRGVTSTNATQELLKQFPIRMRETVLKNAVADGGRVVVKSAKAHARRHRSSATGTRDLWSRKIKTKRAGNKDLFQSLRTVTRLDGSVVMAMSGARWPLAAHAHLLEYGGMFPRWGKRRTYQRPQPFLRPAANETVGEQQQAIVQRVKKEWQRV